MNPFVIDVVIAVHAYIILRVVEFVPAFEVSAFEVSAFEVSAFEVSAFEVSTFEVSAFEVFACRVSFPLTCALPRAAPGKRAFP